MVSSIDINEKNVEIGPDDITGLTFIDLVYLRNKF